MADKIVKVYTRYDIPALSIMVPIIPDLKPMPVLSDDMVLNIVCLNYVADFKYYNISKVTDGIEGVIFIEYEAQK